MIAQAEAVLVEALLRYGPVGLVLIALAVGWLYTKAHVEDLRIQIVELRGELKEARQDIRRANEVAQEILLPVATKTLEAIQQFNSELWNRRRVS